MPADLRYLLVSILLLAAGPLLQYLAHHVPHLLKSVNVVVSVAVGLLVVLHILPDAIADGGLVAIACACAGLAVPTLVEQRLHRLATRAHTAALMLAVAGILVHSVIDGMAIAAPTIGESAHVLPLAILLHRIPAGMAVWFLVCASHGKPIAIVALFLVGFATGVGFLVVDLPIGGESGPAVASFRALVAGSLLHVLLHRTRGHEHEHGVAAHEA
jgi:zinc transporter ZupT